MAAAIRPAETVDIPGIAEVIRLALGDEPDNTLIAAALSLDDHAAFVGTDGERVTGFASGFLTFAPDGTLRWELDLLGVHPDFRRLGIGRGVIQACTRAGQAMGATMAQGLVAVGNIASQKAFRYSGYELLPEMCGLYVSPQHCQGSLIHANGDWFIPVNTMTYRGLWIEGSITPQSLETAQTIRTRYGWHSTGAVVPVSDAGANEALRQAEFELIGKYQWWRRTLRDSPG